MQIFKDIGGWLKSFQSIIWVDSCSTPLPGSHLRSMESIFPVEGFVQNVDIVTGVVDEIIIYHVRRDYRSGFSIKCRKGKLGQ